MTDKTPALLQLVPLPRNDELALPGGYRVLRLWEAPDLESILQTEADHIEVLTTSAVTPTPASLIDRLPNLKAICSFGVGYDSIPVAHAQARGILVSNTPDVLNECVADLAWSLILGTARRVGHGDRFVRAGQWEAKGRFPTGVKVSGKKLGIVGLGRIGTAIAERAAGFRMDIRYHNRTQRADAPWAYEASLVALARWSDFLVVATVGGPSTQGLIDAEVLNALGSKGILVNIARGSVVDETALVEALVEGRLGGAGLDVFVNEPHVPPALKALDNVLLLPHVASGTNETRQAMTDLVLENIAAYASTGKLVTPIVLSPT